MTKHLCLLLAATLVFSSCKLFKKDREETVGVPEAVPPTPEEPKEVMVIEALEEKDETTPYLEDLKDEKKRNSFSLTYERTPCFGKCPVFEFSFNGEGKALYHGKNFVDNIGWYEAQISESEMDTLYETIEAIGYFEMNEKYDALISDLPATITKVTIGEKTHRVYDRYHGPDALQALYENLDTLIANLKWEASAEQKQ